MCKPSCPYTRQSPLDIAFRSVVAYAYLANIEDHPLKIRAYAFANTLGLTTAALAVVLIVLRWITPTLFTFIFNAQFFGADVASLLPEQVNLVKMFGEFVAFVGGAWGFGFVGAHLYNHFIRDCRD